MSHFMQKKSIIIGIILVILLLVTIFLVYHNKSILIFARKSEQLIPNVSAQNIAFNISETEKKVDKVTISVKEKLDNFHLYFYIMPDSKASSNTKEVQSYALFQNEITLDENASIYFKYGANGHYSSEDYELKISNIEIPEIATSEGATKEELKNEKIKKKDVAKTSSSPYYIKVNYKANTITVYKKDKNNKYTVPVRAIICSTGTATPKSGIYKTSNKYRWGKLIHNSYGQYSTRIVGSILFHSVPYSAPKNDALMYKQYDRLGTKASAGCVRLTTIDAKWLYDNCPSGTMVEFYASSNPGPLGKPTAQKISSVVECRNWDPTDPQKGNPWRDYEAKQNQANNNNLATPSTNNTLNNNTIPNSNNAVNNNSIPNSNNTVNNNSIPNSNNTVNNNSIPNSNNTVNSNSIPNSNDTVNNNSIPNSNHNVNNFNTGNIGNNTVGNNVV